MAVAIPGVDVNVGLSKQHFNNVIVSKTHSDLEGRVVALAYGVCHAGVELFMAQKRSNKGRMSLTTSDPQRRAAFVIPLIDSVEPRILEEFRQRRFIAAFGSFVDS